MENTEKDIEINEFLKFLKITCHVNDLIRDSKESNSNSVDFDELASNKIINDLYGFAKRENIENIDSLSAAMNSKSEKRTSSPHSNLRRSSGSVSKQGSRSRGFSGNGEHITQVHPQLTAKLDYIINEGVLDSVLPFVSPVAPPSNQCQGLQKGSAKVKVKDNSPTTTTRLKAALLIDSDCTDAFNSNEANQLPISTISNEYDVISMKRKDTRSLSKRTPQKNLSAENDQDAEVIIHVCDEIKNTSKDFTCPQKLLVSKMGYFADVTAGQKLEDMDISVHCDIQIFEWLMKWIKKNPDQQESLPQLDATNVVPILVSASFLQMEPLLLDCLSFCHARLTDVVRSSTNLSCLNDSIITRLAAMFTNLELEVVKDKKERVTPRLWTKLIQSLCELEPQALRGHYFSLGGLYRCSRCGKYLTQTMSPYISCLPCFTRLNKWGQLISQHTRDLQWDFSNYISSLFKELKSWRKVYWKLWGHCHFLFCCICESHFPVYQMNWCRFHPDGAQFLGPITDGHMAGPAGRYPCCGQQAFRYETLPGQNGCQFREHSILVENDRDRGILTLLQIAAEGGNLFEDPPSALRDEILKKLMEPRWMGLCLMPTKCRPGLLPTLNPEEHHRKLLQRSQLGASNFDDSSTETDASATPEKAVKSTPRMLSTSSDGAESESGSSKKVRRRRNRRKLELSGRFWSGELSARSNQDNQRNFEEKVMKQVATVAGKKIGSKINTTQSSASNCGTYIRLEAEWKEQLKQKNTFKQKFK